MNLNAGQVKKGETQAASPFIWKPDFQIFGFMVKSGYEKRKIGQW
jgi:hypothetical protein